MIRSARGKASGKTKSKPEARTAKSCGAKTAAVHGVKLREVRNLVVAATVGKRPFTGESALRQNTTSSSQSTHLVDIQV